MPVLPLLFLLGCGGAGGASAPPRIAASPPAPTQPARPGAQPDAPAARATPTGRGPAFHSLGGGWWIGLPTSYRRAPADQGGERIWKPGRTTYVLPPQAVQRASFDAELAHARARVAAEALEPLFDVEEDGVVHHAFHRRDDDGSGSTHTVSFLAFDGARVVRGVIYFDLGDDLAWATAVARSVGKREPPAVDPLVDRLHPDGWLVLVEKGAPLSSMSIATRDPGDNPMDSGWRLWRHDTPQGAGVEPAPLAQLLAESPGFRAAMEAEVGALWQRRDGAWERVKG